MESVYVRSVMNSFFMNRMLHSIGLIHTFIQHIKIAFYLNIKIPLRIKCIETHIRYKEYNHRMALEDRLSMTLPDTLTFDVESDPFIMTTHRLEGEYALARLRDIIIQNEVNK